jgi:acetyl-CoA synthetase
MSGRGSRSVGSSAHQTRPEGAAVAEPTISDFYVEDRTFPPPPEFKAHALVSDRRFYDEAEKDYVAFWARQARELISWFDDFHTPLEWELPFAKWFVGGTLNISYNCLDRHVEAGNGDKVAYFWEGEPGDTRIITYRELHREVCKFANVLKSLGLKKGDRVAIYMPMIPELPIAMLACTRIGVAHSAIFGGFSPDAISDRCNDASARLIITADAGSRTSTPPWPMRQQSKRSSSSTAATPIPTWSPTGICGGTS